MNFASVLLICFGALLVAGICEAIAARWELYRKQALMREGANREVRLASGLTVLGPTMADGGGAAEE